MNAAGSRVTIVCLSFLMVVNLIFTTPSKAEIDPESIAGFWLFDEETGKVVKDSSANNNHGDLDFNGDIKWIDGKFGKALEFKGVDYIEIRKSSAKFAFGGTEPFSITAWVSPHDSLVAGWAWGVVLGKFNGDVIGAHFLSVSGDGNITFHREVDPWDLVSSKKVPLNEFSHVAATYDGAEMKIYINGELDAKQNRVAQATDNVTPILIGARFTKGKPSAFFDGILDEIALFNVALTEDQIKEVMKGLSPAKAVPVSGKLVSSWGNIKVYY